MKKFPKSVQDQWLTSRLKEFFSIVGKKAVELVDKHEIPGNAIIIPSAWVFKIKCDGTLKSRLVLLGHLMPVDEEIDMAAPTPRMASLRFLLAFCIKYDMIVEIVDIDTAFTYAVPHTTIYASIPSGLYSDGRLDGKYMHLLRNLYGSASAPVMFHNLLHNVCIAEGFEVNPHEPCLYFRWLEDTPIFLLVHVDDCVIASTQEHVDELKRKLQLVFSIKDLGPLGRERIDNMWVARSTVLLGLEITRTDTEFQIKQSALIDALVAKVGNELSSIPHELVPMRDVHLTHNTSPTTRILRKPSGSCVPTGRTLE